jgi:hypothetical protein
MNESKKKGVAVAFSKRKAAAWRDNKNVDVVAYCGKTDGGSCSYQDAKRAKPGDSNYCNIQKQPFRLSLCGSLKLQLKYYYL